MAVNARRDDLGAKGGRQSSAKLIALLLGGVMLVGMALLLPPAIDWHGVFRPATLALLAGESPYGVEGFYSPPWTLLPLLPFW